jgi:hypothetical protein
MRYPIVLRASLLCLNLGRGFENLSETSRVRVLVLDLFLLASLVLGGDVNAQQGLSSGRIVPAPKQAAGEGNVAQTLLLLVRCNPELTAEQIRETLQFGSAAAGCEVSQIVVREVAPHTLDEVESVLRLIDRPEGGEVNIEELQLSRRPAVHTIWDIKLSKAPEETIESFDVALQKIGSSADSAPQWKTYRPVVPEAANLESGSFVAVSLRNGRYEFYPPPGEMPTEFRVSIIGEDGSKREVTGKFPQLDRCFLIQMVNFRGDRARLFEVVRNPAEVPNPFSDIKERSNTAVVFGNIRGSTAVVGETLDGLELVVSVPGVPGRAPARVWMLFPLTAERLAQEEANLKGLEQWTKLPEEIRRRAVKSTDPQVPIIDSEEPRWYELVPAGSGFEQRIKLVTKPEDFPKLRQRFPRIYRILVWEFEGGGGRAPISVDGGRPYRSEELNSWGRLLEAYIR